jgi:hypothetical protein
MAAGKKVKGEEAAALVGEAGRAISELMRKTEAQSKLIERLRSVPKGPTKPPMWGSIV